MYPYLFYRTDSSSICYGEPLIPHILKIILLLCCNFIIIHFKWKCAHRWLFKQLTKIHGETSESNFFSLCSFLNILYSIYWNYVLVSQTYYNYIFSFNLVKNYQILQFLPAFFKVKVKMKVIRIWCSVRYIYGSVMLRCPDFRYSNNNSLSWFFRVGYITIM
jgi:hypothetical protein